MTTLSPITNPIFPKEGSLVQQIAASAGKGIFGISFAAMGGIVNDLSAVETESLRLWLPWGVALLVAVLTAVSITLDIIKKWRNRNKP